MKRKEEEKNGSKFNKIQQQKFKFKHLVKMKSKSKHKSTSNKIMERDKYYEDMLLVLINSGESNKLVDLLARVNINLEKVDEDGNTPFNIAAQNGNFNTVLALIKAGANMNTQNFEGNTPLHYAYTYNFPRILSLLLTNGANQLLKNNKGNSPWEGIS